MITSQPLSLFISSKMKELETERRAIETALSKQHRFAWLWEEDAVARPETIRNTYLKEVEACDIVGPKSNIAFLERLVVVNRRITSLYT